MPAIPTGRPSPSSPASPPSPPPSPIPASRAPWLALLLIVAFLLVANRRPLADALAGVTSGPLASLLGGKAGGVFAGRDAWPIVPAPGPMIILGPAAPVGVGLGLEGEGRRAIRKEWGPGEVGD